MLTLSRRFLVALLIVLLPLHGFAAAVSLCCAQAVQGAGPVMQMSTAQHEASAAMPSCHAHGKMGKADGSTAKDDVHKCSLCATCGGIAMNNAQAISLSPVASTAVIPLPDPFQQAHLAAGPDKPPRFLA